ncbi:MAG: DUF433 domain-containing protein [Rhodomicrobium sp.]
MSNQHQPSEETRITFNPAQCGGRPCIRGMRIRVSDILEMLAEGASVESILADFPDLEREDIMAALRFAAHRIDIPRLAA